MLRLSSLRLSSIFLLAFFLLIFVGTLAFPVFAANYTAYSSVSSSDSVTKNLIGIYRNSPDFDPFNQYVVCRTGQYEYYVFYAKNLAEDYKYYRYHGTVNQGYVNYYYDSGEGNNLRINTAGYKVVGNVEDSIASEQFETFKFQFVLIPLAILLLVLLIFKTFKRRYVARRSSGWDL